jgi:outer membrane protein TolC
VKVAYWNLVSARANVVARRSTLESAQELARVNKAKVDVGTLPPLDLLSAQAEVASNQEQLIIAETAVKQAEDRLRMLIFDTTKRENWNVSLDAVDSPPLSVGAVDVDAAVTRALADRADLARSRKEIDNAQTSLRFAGNQRLPDVRLNASYQASGLGGTQVLRTGGFPGTIAGPGAITDFGASSISCSPTTYPTWSVGVSVSYPLGESVDQANHARAQLERSQAAERLKSAEARAIQQDPRRRVEDRHEREAHRDDPRRARAGRAAARRRTQTLRCRHVDELSCHSGAARSRQGAHQRTECSARLRFVAGGLRRTAAGRTDGSGGAGCVRWL